MIRLRRFRRHTAALLAAVTVTTGAAAVAHAAVAVTVTVGEATAGRSGPGFAGFSYEKDRVGAGVFDARNTGLVALFRLLGPGVLRLGGNLADMVGWNPDGAGGSATEIAPSDVDKLAGFLKAAGWKALYGINLKQNTAARAASEAAYAAKALGTTLAAFEIGNEPNYYRSEPAYETSYDSYVKAIRARVPGALFDGPGAASDTSWPMPFATHERAAGLAVLSMHTYIGPNTAASVAGMLASTAPGGALARQWSAMAAAKAAGGIGQWRMTEANSYFHGGAPGVSDVQAAALWALDFLNGVASHDGSGVHFHGGTSTQFPLYYSPIAFAGSVPTGVQAVYYAELLWSLAGTGPVHAATVSGASGVSAWGIGDAVVVNNKSGSALTATVRPAGTVTAADAYVLTAPALTSKAVTIAGSAVTANGDFHPQPRALPVSGGTVTATVPSGSAVLIRTR
ncbi:glycosyl hydrolase family 79 C-terminal domain-containing protein [Amycolatopsis sp. NEAU-NG30]|uniref:Glycosyl hydrolase family 79 C-terminal domain-containing protein n=1 Tax=Amycolatopsis melonis TaxID=3156488 RepID=A0ABV0LSD7_9PSEU